jgi:hypothetical protein
MYYNICPIHHFFHVLICIRLFYRVLNGQLTQAISHGLRRVVRASLVGHG